MEIDVQIDAAFAGDLSEDWVRDVAGLVLQAQKVLPNTEVGLVIADDDMVADLNQRYRGKEGTTDVLSFAMTEGEAFVVPPDGTLRLGDVVISCPQARRQAQELGHSLQEEVARLLAHGVLHLLGYDHQEPAQRARMRRRERTIMTLLEKRWAGRSAAAS